MQDWGVCCIEGELFGWREVFCVRRGLHMVFALFLSSSLTSCMCARARQTDLVEEGAEDGRLEAPLAGVQKLL